MHISRDPREYPQKPYIVETRVPFEFGDEPDLINARISGYLPVK